MMFASCSNEEGFVNPNEGKTSEVTVAMSVKGTKASAGEVNMDGTVSEIKNVVVVPMVGDAYQTPIVFGNVTPADEPETRTKTLPQTVNHFRVYGNPTVNNAKENVVFTPTTLEFTTGTDVIGKTGAYAPHGLYYYADFDKNFQVATGSDWGTDAWTTVNASGIGQNTLVKLSGVKYAVGVLAAAIQNGDNTTVFSDTEDMGTTATWTGNEVEVSGIIVYNQTKAFNDKLVAQSEKVAVYDEVAAGKGAITDTKVSDGSRSTGNLYCVVAPSADKTVTLNIEFVAKKYFKLADNNKTLVAPGTKFYLPVVLNKPAEGGDIFSAATATFLNAKVMNWGLASKTPVESTDVTIGVEFETEWAAGLNFDVEI